MMFGIQIMNICQIIQGGEYLFYSFDSAEYIYFVAWSTDACYEYNFMKEY